MATVEVEVDDGALLQHGGAGGEVKERPVAFVWLMMICEPNDTASGGSVPATRGREPTDIPGEVVGVVHVQSKCALGDTHQVWARPAYLGTSTMV